MAKLTPEEIRKRRISPRKLIRFNSTKTEAYYRAGTIDIKCIKVRFGSIMVWIQTDEYEYNGEYRYRPAKR